jgi:hypothetical protein
MDGIGAGAASAPSICSSGIYRNLLHCVLAVVPTALDAAQSPQRKPAERCPQRSFAALMTPAQPSEADVCLKKRQYSPSVAFDDIQTNDGSQPLSRFGAPRDCPSCCVGAPKKSLHLKCDLWRQASTSRMPGSWPAATSAGHRAIPVARNTSRRSSGPGYFEFKRSFFAMPAIGRSTGGC